jgi:Tfp pilus assembly protein PilF
MRRLITFSVVVLFSIAGSSSAQSTQTNNEKQDTKVKNADSVEKGDRGKSKEQVQFGINVAQNNLWNEALYRWQQAVKLDPSYAAAWNNLAIAYEHDGKFEEAKKAYEQALTLDPKNLMIRQNYDLFKEINDRTKRRGGK